MKFIKIFKFLLVSICLMSCTGANAEDSFYLVEIKVDTRRAEIPDAQLAASFGFKVKRDSERNMYIDPITLSKTECQKQIDILLGDYNTMFKSVKDKDNYYMEAQRSIAKESYILDELTDTAFNYYCIPVKTWDSMKTRVKSTEVGYVAGDELRYKSMDSFLSILKKCGLKKFDVNHINTAKTPFICDEYSESNPVPYKSYNDLSGLNRWK